MIVREVMTRDLMTTCPEKTLVEAAQMTWGMNARTAELRERRHDVDQETIAAFAV